MTFANAMTTLETHMTTVGAALDPVISHVRRGEPLGVEAQMIAFWYEGDEPWDGPTFTRNHVYELVTLRAFWPIRDDNDPLAERADIQLQAFVRATKAAILGDDSLGGSCDSVRVGDAVAAWQVIGGVTNRVVSIPLALAFPETETIAP